MSLSTLASHLLHLLQPPGGASSHFPIRITNGLRTRQVQEPDAARQGRPDTLHCNSDQVTDSCPMWSRLSPACVGYWTHNLHRLALLFVDRYVEKGRGPSLRTNLANEAAR